MFAISGKNALTNTHRDTGTPTHTHKYTPENILYILEHTVARTHKHIHIVKMAQPSGDLFFAFLLNFSQN